MTGDAPQTRRIGRAAAVAMVLGAGVLFSTGGAAVKSTTLSALHVAGLRAAIAVPVLLLLVPRARRCSNPRVWLVATAYAATLSLFVIANKLTTAANTVFLQTTAPLWVLLLGPWLLREPVRRRDIAVLLCIAAGMSLFFFGSEAPSESAPAPGLGNLAAAGAGLAYGLTVIGLRWLARLGAPGEDAAAAVAGNVLTAIVCLALSWPPAVGSAVDWLTILYLGVFQVGLAYVLLTRAMRGVSAVEASLLLMAEPALSPLWAHLLHGETPSGPAVAGGALILGAVLARSWRA